MVMIFGHTVVAVYQFLKRIYNTALRGIGPKMGISEGLQEAVLRLTGVVTFDQLESAVCEALELALPRVSDVLVYVLSQECQELVSSQGLVHTLPKDGLPWEAIQRRERLVVERLDESDPVAGLLSHRSATMPAPSKGLLCCGVGMGRPNKYRVLCSPVVDRENERVVAVFVVVCDPLTSDDHQHLSFLEKQFLVCYRRLKTTSQYNGTQPPTTRERSLSTSSAILKLCADLYDQDAAALQVKVIQYLMEQTQCESGFIILTDLQHRELFCQVIGDQKLKEEIRFSNEENSFSTVFKTRRPISLEDVNPRHRQQLERALSCRLQSLLASPVVHQLSGDVVAVACLTNKLNAPSFTEQDTECIQQCFKYTSSVLHSTLAVQRERLLKNQTQAMLQVAKKLFTHLDDLTQLLREIMQEARNLTSAERCSVFLLDKDTNELVAKVFDGDIQDGKECEVRIPASQGIAGHVATTGTLLNIDDAYSHPLFYRGLDETTGFRTRNILCFPIKNETGEVIGVAQLCNKVKGAGFSAFDEDIAQAFSVFCCISIAHSLLYQKVNDAQHRSRLSNELMIFHMQVSEEDCDRLSLLKIPAPAYFSPECHQFTFIPRSIRYEETPLAVHSMFEDLGFISKFRISRDALAKFVLMVRKGYRDPPYHNWAHAFAVAHFCYLSIKNLNLLNYIDEIEAFALFVSCLCHDIDHRGTTNSYQVASGSVLAALYSSEGSVMERHHLAQTMCILNTDGCNIFDNLSKADYERVLDLVRDIILATDLANHLRILKDIETMAEEGYDRSNADHRQLMLSLLMTSCDLSDQTKTWKNSKKIAELIYQEFFSQGDLEKTLGRKPLDMMDRDKACIPELQVGFLDGVALPVFRLLARLFPEADVVVRNVDNNRQFWVRVNQKMRELNLPTNMEVFNVDFDEHDVH